jgi:hypothetical protein
MKKSTLTPKFLNLINKFEDDLNLLRDVCSTIQEAAPCNDSTGISDFQEKQALADDLNSTISYTFFISFRTYCKFRKRCLDEGYTIQEGFNRLLDAYVDDRITVKED